MININKLKGVKTTVLSALLATGAVLTPLKGQSATTVPLTNDTITAITPKDAAKRKQLFEMAVRANLPTEEIIKYIDFPDFIPVNENGQLDEKKVVECVKALNVQKNLPYFKDYCKEVWVDYIKKDGQYVMDTNKYFQTMAVALPKLLDKLSIDLSPQKKQEIQKYFMPLGKELKNISRKISLYQRNELLCVSDSLLPILGTVGLIMLCCGGFKRLEGDAKTIAVMLGLTGLILLPVSVISRIDDALKGGGPAYVEKSLKDTFSQNYKTYVSETIKTEKERQMLLAKQQFNQQTQKN